MGLKRRKSFSFILFFYTLIGSVLMLLGIFVIYSNTGTTYYQTLCGLKLDGEIQK